MCSGCFLFNYLTENKGITGEKVGPLPALQFTMLSQRGDFTPWAPRFHSHSHGSSLIRGFASSHNSSKQGALCLLQPEPRFWAKQVFPLLPCPLQARCSCLIRQLDQSQTRPYWQFVSLCCPAPGVCCSCGQSFRCQGSFLGLLLCWCILLGVSVSQPHYLLSAHHYHHHHPHHLLTAQSLTPLLDNCEVSLCTLKNGKCPGIRMYQPPLTSFPKPPCLQGTRCDLQESLSLKWFLKKYWFKLNRISQSITQI